MQLLRRWVVVSVALLALGACGGGDLVLPNEGQPAQVEGISGDAQTGTILEPLRDSLVVKVTDRFGNPVPGIEVSWSAGDGGEVRPATSVTGVDGRAATQRMLGTEPGTYGTTAVALGAAGGRGVVHDDRGGGQADVDDPAARRRLIRRSRSIRSRCSSSRIPAGTPLAREGVTVSVQIASGQGP